MQIEQGSETEAPEDGKNVQGQEVGVGDVADLGEDGEGGHNDGWFFGFDGFEEGDDLFLDGVFVQDGAAVVASGVGVGG